MINEVYNCDCMEYMATIPDKFFDLAIADPPYGIGVNKKMVINDGKKHGRAKANRSFFPSKDHQTNIPTAHLLAHHALNTQDLKAA